MKKIIVTTIFATVLFFAQNSMAATDVNEITWYNNPNGEICASYFITCDNQPAIYTIACGDDVKAVEKEMKDLNEIYCHNF
jgi:regulatory protein YycH of two-component signal transduction system YycFG